MKLTKKAAALLLAAPLAVSVCAMPVFADDPATTPSLPGTQATGADGLTTKVLYEVTGGYTWSVPATINFGKNAGGGAQKRTVNATETAEKESTEATETAGTAPKVFVTKNVIAPGKTLKINLKAQDGNAFEVKTSKDGKEATLTYKVKTTAETIDGTPTTPYTTKPVDAKGTDILALKAGKNTGDVALEFELTTAKSKAEIAGKYEGNVVFVADATT